MPDHGKHLVLCSKAVYPVPVGTDEHRKRISLTKQASVVKAEVHAQLNQKSIRYNWHEADVTVLEGIPCTRRPEGWRMLSEKRTENGAIL